MLTPIADQITAELAALKNAGFTDSQAKTIIVAKTIQAGNESKRSDPPATPATPSSQPYAIDSDGDRWEPVAGAADLWYCVDYNIQDRSLAALQDTYGPLTHYGDH